MGFTTSPLRYPGGKTRLSNFIKQTIIDNGLLGGHYVETYAGGAGVAWSLLFDGYVEKVHINDLNTSVYAFWETVFNDTDALCKLIKDTPVTMQTWQEQKNIQTNPGIFSRLELGFSTFFLNRTNRSGIIWGGVIGGKNQDSEYKLDARYNKAALIKRVQKIALHKEKVHLYNLDALIFTTNLLPTIPEKSLVYFDPPYYKKGAKLYENHYKHEDHISIAKAIKEIKQKWIVSYDNVQEIQSIYDGYKKVTYDLSYSTANRYSGSEVVFFSNNITVPKSQSPLLYAKPKRHGQQLVTIS